VTHFEMIPTTTTTTTKKITFSLGCIN
jgi:hypothetical protein